MYMYLQQAMVIPIVEAIVEEMRKDMHVQRRRARTRAVTNQTHSHDVTELNGLAAPEKEHQTVNCAADIDVEAETNLGATVATVGKAEIELCNDLVTVCDLAVNVD